ncbi:aspartic peptidase A1 [Crucibulum laeve]|uniref:Aspartic peptidase A1 n=1 Tax=Crucibulum laeve TaxID=68775 RepID=A0A5C3M5Z7_9AGAR|nr:aspartic peptidase A1 [Crucibulum laeve]
MRSLIPLSLLLAVLDTPVYGLRVPFEVRIVDAPSTSLARRATPIPISNTGNAQYISNVTLGGTTLPLLLDTGSSDLWVHFPSTVPSGTTDTGDSLSLSYAVGKVAGNVHTTKVQFGDYSVDNQAFLLVEDTSTFTSDIHAQGYDGLLGLGPNGGSQIRKKLDKDTGDSLLTHIFEQDNTTENYITFLLDRKGDSTDPFTGQFTIGEVVPGFENVTSMPKLDVETVQKILEADQHWQALTDKDNGIIGPDGQAIKLKSIVPKAPSGQFVAVIDSGFTFSQVPRDVSDAIYGRVRGAVYDTKNEYWTIPCGQLLNLTFMFGGKPYPVHPLDVVDNNFSKTDANGKRVCIGAFQPITSAFSVLGHYDMILGMSFLRNAYTLLDFGDWIDDTKDQGHPYIQMTSLLDVPAARRDFIQIRLGGNDTTGDEQWSLLPVDQMQKSPVSEEEKKKLYQEMILSRWPYILIGCLAFLVLVAGLCIWKCCCRKKTKKTKSQMGIFKGKAESSAYLPLQEPHRHHGTGAYPPPQYGFQPTHGDYGSGGQGYNGNHSHA